MNLVEESVLNKIKMSIKHCTSATNSNENFNL